jgi:hypothetical protein
MNVLEDFRDQSPEFWAVVKLVSPMIGYSYRGKEADPSKVRRYTVGEIADALKNRDLEAEEDLLEAVAAYSAARAELLESAAAPNLMNREEARELFEKLRSELKPPDAVLPMNKQKGEKRHPAYLTCILNMITWRALTERFGNGDFDSNPREALTFSRDGRPLRTLARWMDGAFPGTNQPIAAWEIKEYYGTTSFGSRIADGVYVAGLDGYELNELRSIDLDVKHYLFIDAREWWDKGKSYLCRIVDLVQADLLDAAFCGREIVSQWPVAISQWPDPPTTS